MSRFEPEQVTGPESLTGQLVDGRHDDEDTLGRRGRLAVGEAHDVIAADGGHSELLREPLGDTGNMRRPEAERPNDSLQERFVSFAIGHALTETPL